MLYRQKKDVLIRKTKYGAYILSKENYSEKIVNESGSVFLCALSKDPQSIETLADTILKSFVGADKETIISDAIEFYETFVKEGFVAKGETEAELNEKDASGIYNSDCRVYDGRNKIHFFIPGLDLQYQGFYSLFFDYIKKFPYRFMDNIDVPAVYGSFNNMIWNGGRVRRGVQPALEEIKSTIKTLNDFGIAVRFTYTNSLVEEKHLQDTMCNLTMEIANNGMNEVLVNSPLLEDYLRKTYPNFKYILSTTACVRDVNKINEATKKYDLVVLDWRDNRNFDFLKKIQDKEKIEILVDEKCPSSCSNRKADYAHVSKVNLYQATSDELNLKCMRAVSDVAGFYRGLKFNRDTNLTFNDIYGKYYDMGFRNFKLMGRNEQDLLSLFESYIYYMATPECRDIVRYDLLTYYMDYLIRDFGGNRTSAIRWHEENLKKSYAQGK